MRVLVVVAQLVAGLLAAVLLTPLTSAAGTVAVVNTAAPTVHGQTVFDRLLRARPGTWEPADVSHSYRWLRDGRPITDASGSSYRLGLADLGARISVQVTATHEASGESGVATSEPSSRVRRAELRTKRLPSVEGVARFTRTVRATAGRWSAAPTRVRYQWFRSGKPIAGATKAAYRYAPRDVGRRVRVQVSVKAPGHSHARAMSERLGPVGHRVEVRRTVTYRVETRGTITTSLAEFRRQAQQTFTDPRGWRASGIRFRRVAGAGAFTLVLAEASRVPSFSPVCSSNWSCRVGGYVIINQDRWKHASPAWNAARGRLRDYRHMVVNHETGHWLGLGHAGCSGRGSPAPVMMQQSKGLAGCRFNPWPTDAERASRTPR